MDSSKLVDTFFRNTMDLFYGVYGADPREKNLECWDILNPKRFSNYVRETFAKKWQSSKHLRNSSDLSDTLVLWRIVLFHNRIQLKFTSHAIQIENLTYVYSEHNDCICKNLHKAQRYVLILFWLIFLNCKQSGKMEKLKFRSPAK